MLKLVKISTVAGMVGFIIKQGNGSKSMKKISTIAGMVGSMVKEANESKNIKDSKKNIKEDISKLTDLEVPKSLVKNLVVFSKAQKEALDGIMNSDEVKFIKMGVQDSDKYKKVTGTLEKVDDMIPEDIKLEYVNYKYWCINWFNIGKMGLSAPLPVMKGILKYHWMFDFIKCNAMVTKYVENRKGANVAQTQKQLCYLTADMCDMVKHALVHPEETVLKQNMVPGELLQAMGIKWFIPESIGTIISKTDQHSVESYLDITETSGLGQDTCGLPRITTGIALKGEMPQGSCVVASNLPCDGGLSSYKTIQKSIGDVPAYRFSVPYDFRNDESMNDFADDLKGMIKFLEENTGKKMDWDKLREICGDYNEMVDIESERWELARLDNPPMTNDCIWFTHYYNFNATEINSKLIKHQRGLLEMAKKAHEKGICADKNMRYRTVVWNPPPSHYGHMWNWLERCWGIDALMDLESYGPLEHIDTATPESILKGLGRRYMWAPMAKHTRGPAENLLGDLRVVIEQYRPDFILFPSHVGCKNTMSLEADIRDVCKEYDLPFCIYRYELIDNRVASRQRMRSDVSKFMTEVMHAEPLDESLLNFDDYSEGEW